MGNRSRRREGEPRSATRVVVGAVAVVVIAAAAVAIGASVGSDTPAGAPSATDGGITGEFQPVTVTGTPLEPRGEGDTDPAAGVEAPTLTGKDFRGREVVIDPGSDGRPTMLVFLAHWCPHCNREVPRILELDADGGIPDAVRVVGVATGSRADQPNWPPSAWLEKMGWKWERMADSETADAFMAYGGSSYPTMVFVKADGTVQNRVSGEQGVVALRGLVNGLMEGAASA
ncbi:MAG: TlpA family protein disulfide reductase [Actinomycetota bacterium]